MNIFGTNCNETIAAAILKAEALRTIERRNRRRRDDPEECPGALPPVLLPGAGSNGTKARAAELDRAVLELLATRPSTTARLAEHFGVDKPRVKSATTRLRTRGHIDRERLQHKGFAGGGQEYLYRATEAGREALKECPAPMTAPEPSAPVAPNPAGFVQTYLARSAPSASTENNRIMRVSLRQAPWERAAE